MLRSLIGMACPQSFKKASVLNRLLNCTHGASNFGRVTHTLSQFCSINLGLKRFGFNSIQFFEKQRNWHDITTKDYQERIEESPKEWNISSWFVLVAGLLVFLGMKNTAQADGEIENQESERIASEKTRVVTKENFQEIILNLRKDNPFIASLEMGFALTEVELKTILNSIHDNTELGFISWHTDQIRYEALERIESKLIESNKNYRYNPTDYVHGLLSKHAYVNAKRGDIPNLGANFDNQQLKDWRVASIHNDTTVSGYYSAIYVNDKTHQVVLAIRGTEGTALDMLKSLVEKNSDWKTNLEEILGGQIIVGQQARNLQATAEAIELAQKLGYRFSVTGHSLGAWLAELSVYYSYAFFDYRNIKAVTFDSPGSVPMIEKLQSNIISKDTRIKLENIEIVTYLAGPNPANSCNGHVGRVYRVEPEMKMTEKMVNKLPDFVKNTFGDKIKGLLSVEGHGLSGILATFDPETGKPRESKKMLDWPRIEYVGGNTFSSHGKSVAKEGIGKMNMSSVTQTALNMALDQVIGDRSLMTIVGFLKAYIKGEVDAQQYWAYFNHIDLEKESGEKWERRTELSFDNRFALITLGKYRVGNDTHTLKLSTGSIDKYLYKLYGFKEKLSENEDLPLIIKLQLKGLLESFKIVRNGEDFILIPNKGCNVEEIRSKAKRVLDVIPEEIRKVWRNVIVHKTKIYLAGEVEEGEKKIKKIADNLPLTAFYIGISDKEEELRFRLNQDEENVVVISGLGGMGKSTLATKQGKDYKQKGWQVRWIKSTQIDEEFFQIAKEFKIKTNNLSPDQVRDLVYKEFEKVGREKPVLLIFDNVDDGAKIRQYLENQPAGVKVLITSRNADIVKGIRSIQMNGFNKEQAISYVREALGKSKATAERLVETIGLSPFRLSKAVGYLWSNSLMSINEYIANYEAIKKGHKHDGEIYPEMEMLFVGLKMNAPSSWQLLKYMAYLDAEGVSLEFIMKVMGKTKEELQKDVNELKRSSLINEVSEGEEVMLKPSHRIVQEETKRALMLEGKDEVKVVLEKLVIELNRIFEYIDEKKPDFSKKKILEMMPHAKMLINEANAAGVLHMNARLMSDIGFYYHDMFHDYKEAIHYWEELVRNQKLLDTLESPQLFKASIMLALGEAHFRLGKASGVDLKGNVNILKSLKYNKEALEIFKKEYSGNHEDIALALLSIGIVHFNLEEGNNMQLSLQYHLEALQMLRQLHPKGHRDLQESLFRVGFGYLFLKGDQIYKLGEEEKRLGVKHLEEALLMHQRLEPKNIVKVGELLGFIGLGYRFLGDSNKDLEYQKQAYSILHNMESDGLVLNDAKLEIQKNQSKFFSRKDAQQDCLGGSKVGSECRYIITSRGQTDENLLKIKGKIQDNSLYYIGLFGPERGWSSIGLLGGEWGIKHYSDKDFLKNDLGDLGNTNANIELAQMLCFEAMNLGIMKLEEKRYLTVQEFTRENPQLVKKIAEQHPEFFVDGSIVEACIKTLPNDKSFERHILNHVKYAGMEHRKG